MIKWQAEQSSFTEGGRIALQKEGESRLWGAYTDAGIPSMKFPFEESEKGREASDVFSPV